MKYLPNLKLGFARGPFYVKTIADGGDNATAVVGDPDNPFATLQYIFDNYNLGTYDSIYI